MTTRRSVISVLYFLAAPLLSTSVHAQEIPIEFEKVQLSPDNVFMPPGFDSNDNSQVVVAGAYQNTCYEALPPEVTISKWRKKITIRNRAMQMKGCLCIEVRVPYMHVVNFSTLKAGEYTIAVENEDGKEKAMGTLPVAVAKNELADDFLYAPVDEISPIEVRPGQFDLVLRGELPSKCMRVKEVQVMRRQPGVVEVLPVLEVIDAGVCYEQPGDAYEERISLGEGIMSPTLIHVRSMGGLSLNRVIKSR